MDESAAMELLAAADGGTAPALTRRLMLQAAGAELPDDPLSAMLAVQMAAVHEAALSLLRRAGDSTDTPETEALYARQAARLLHLFQRQAKTLERRRETARLEAQVAKQAEIERRQAEDLKRRRELEERLWDPDYEEDEEIGEEDAIAVDETGDDAAAWAAAAADRHPTARDAPPRPDTAEICARLGALFAHRAAEKRGRPQATGGRNGTGRTNRGDGTGSPERPVARVPSADKN